MLQKCHSPAHQTNELEKENMGDSGIYTCSPFYPRAVGQCPYQPTQSQDEQVFRDSRKSVMPGVGGPRLKTHVYDQLASGLGHTLHLPGRRAIREEVETDKSSFVWEEQCSIVKNAGFRARGTSI